MFVVYRVKTGRTVGVYDREGSAKTQVTRNNRELMMRILQNQHKEDHWDRKEEWAYCSYADYAPHFRRFFKENRPYY